MVLSSPPSVSLILIVDDIPSNLSVLSSTLIKEGYEIAVATSGERALRQLENIHPDLILLDIDMPSMDGFSLCQKLKSDPLTKAIPIIFITALSDIANKVRGLELGAVDYIIKPFHDQEVLLRVKNHIQLRRLTQNLEQEILKQTFSIRAAKEKEEKINQELIKNIQEKEILIKEIHHRVKNNLLIASSLIEWSAESVEEPTLINAFRQAESRIMSMALIHEKLYESPDLSKIDLMFYVQSLVRQVSSFYVKTRQQVSIRLNLEPLHINIETATPCGLIINELLLNTFCHALKHDRTGEVCLTLKQEEDQKIRLTYQDSHIGLSPELDVRKEKAITWQLIRLLTDQLDGSINFIRCQNTMLVLTFSELVYQHQRL